MGSLDGTGRKFGGDTVAGSRRVPRGFDAAESGVGSGAGAV